MWSSRHLFARFTQRQLFTFLIPISVILFSIAIIHPPELSADLYYYTIMSRGMVIYHQNPYFTTPSAFKLDQSFPLIAKMTVNQSTIYGPLWTIVSALPVVISKNIISNFIGIKIINSIGYILAGFILFFTLVHKRPEFANIFLGIWLINPAAIFEIGNAGHNEGMLLLGLSIFVTGLLQHSPSRALGGLSVAIAIKFWPVIFFPTILGIQNATKKQWIQSVVIFFLPLLSFLPFWKGMQTLHSLFDHSATFSPHNFSPGLLLLSSILTKNNIAELGFSQARLIVTVIFILAILFIIPWLLKKTDRALLACQIILTFFLGIVLNWVQPWYLLSWFPLSVSNIKKNSNERYILAMHTFEIFIFYSYLISWGRLMLCFIILFIITAAFLLTLYFFLPKKILSSILKLYNSTPKE